MGHHHHHHHSYKNIKLAFQLNLIFTIIEFVGGIITGSVAIQSDAIHDLGDSLALGFALLMERLSHKKANTEHSYGFRRFSLVAGIVTGLVLLLGSIYVLYTSIPRLVNPVNPNTTGMFFLALLGVSVNGFAAWKLSHGHGHNERIMSWHLWEDVLGWVAVLVISIIMNFVEVPILDPILSIIIAIVIFAGAIRALVPTIKVLLQATPEGVDIQALTEKICALEGVINVHDFHCWSLDGQQHVATLQIVAQDTLDVENIKTIREQIRRLLKADHDMHVTIEVKTEDEPRSCFLHDGT